MQFYDVEQSLPEGARKIYIAVETTWIAFTSDISLGSGWLGLWVSKLILDH